MYFEEVFGLIEVYAQENCLMSWNQTLFGFKQRKLPYDNSKKHIYFTMPKINSASFFCHEHSSNVVP